MDTSNLKNIVVLKDLPSNIVEEAIVVLKENQKVPKLEHADKEIKKNNIKPSENNKSHNKTSKDYIIKEAQMLIADYISKIENKNKKENKTVQNLKSKYKKVRAFNYVLIGCLALSVILNIL